MFKTALLVVLTGTSLASEVKSTPNTGKDCCSNHDCYPLHCQGAKPSGCSLDFGENVGTCQSFATIRGSEGTKGGGMAKMRMPKGSGAMAKMGMPKGSKGNKGGSMSKMSKASKSSKTREPTKAPTQEPTKEPTHEPTQDSSSMETFERKLLYISPCQSSCDSIQNLMRTMLFNSDI